MNPNKNNFTALFSVNHKILFIIFIFILKLGKYFNQTSEGLSFETLETNSQLLDVNDYHNFSLIVTTSKNIYTGIPPTLRSTTNAALINASSLITLNENYLLASCLGDSLLTKININTGDYSSLLNYSDINNENITLEIPITSCSLSIMDNIIFIGYSRIDYLETETNKTNILIKFNITNIDLESGPELETPFGKNFLCFLILPSKQNQVGKYHVNL